MAWQEPWTEQGLRVSDANFRDDDRPCRDPPHAQPNCPCMRLFKHPLTVGGCVNVRLGNNSDFFCSIQGDYCCIILLPFTVYWQRIYATNMLVEDFAVSLNRS